MVRADIGADLTYHISAPEPGHVFVAAGGQGEELMAKYIVLTSWTDQGIRKVKESPARLDQVRELAKKYDCALTDFYMTVGAYDMVVTLDAPDDDTAAKLLIAIASAGNIRTTTLKAFPEDDFRKIVGEV
jgi:uncharacterized protein with GYD domain